MRVIVVALALFLVPAIPTSGAPRPRDESRPTVLRDYGGDWFTVPTAINNRGAIAGWAADDDGSAVAFFRTVKGRYRTIAANAAPTDVNDRGVVVGLLFPCPLADCPVEGFAWSARGGLRHLGSFVPYAVNEKGDMAGVCATEWQACVLRDGVVSVVAGPDSEALGINDRGAVVGTYGDNRAFHLSPNWRFRDLGRAVANDINDKGVIAGHRWVQMGARGERAVITAWTNGRPRSPSREVSLGVAINDRGWLIANAWDANEQSYSFAWNAATGARVRLAGVGDEYVQVEDINDRGQVVGTVGVDAVIWRVRR